MPREIEAKLRVESHDPVRERLRALGATPLSHVLEMNHIFDRPDGSLRNRGSGLRIRSAKDTATGERSHTLTLKGPVAAGPFKSREELEVEVSDAETVATMLGQLGLVRIVCYGKRRESWRLGDCRIELDEPPHIGLFVEIEGPNETAIRVAQNRLGLEDAAHERASYVHMLMAYCDEHGIAGRVLDLPDAQEAQG